MNKKSTAVIGMVVVCFMMMATFTWALGVPNGTVTDGNLVWLQDANCFGGLTWNQAKDRVASLKSRSCGLTDGSTAGQWRLPTKDELVRRSKKQQGFNNVQAGYYWSSSTDAANTAIAWFVVMNVGIADLDYKVNYFYVWPVRSGK